jgi:hypothetical protein
MDSKSQRFTLFLCLYHLMFAAIAWQYSSNNPGDAQRYWHLTQHWTSYLNIGTDVVKLINYPFAKILHLPYWTGFLIHSMISYAGIYELYKFALKYINPISSGSRYLLMLIFLLPNLHFWTSVIGKEPIVFLAITWILLKQYGRAYLSFKYIFGWLLLILIRPHVAMFLLISISLASVFSGKKLTRQKVILILASLVLSVGLYLLTMQLLNRNPFDIAYILQRNDASLLAFKRAGSYVPMIDYNFVERLFALNFRPVFSYSYSLFQAVLSMESIMTLFIMLYAIYIYCRNYRTTRPDMFTGIAMLFFLISSLFFIQRYSCLGIFVRTRIMYLPFVLIAALKIINTAKPFRGKEL